MNKTTVMKSQLGTNGSEPPLTIAQNTKKKMKTEQPITTKTHFA